MRQKISKGCELCSFCFYYGLKQSNQEMLDFLLECNCPTENKKIDKEVYLDYILEQDIRYNLCMLKMYVIIDEKELLFKIVKRKAINCLKNELSTNIYELEEEEKKEIIKLAVDSNNIKILNEIMDKFIEF